MNIYAANRGPAVFPDPHRFDVTRANAHRHLGLGHGGHLCLGHALARAEMAEAPAVFVRSLPDLRQAGDPDYPEGLSSMSGAERIPLTNHPQQ
ncbi:cytochrome P450 [Streptomyces asiaticus]